MSSDVSTSTSSSDVSNTTFSSIEEYFGESVSVDDIMDMSVEEREAYFTELYAGSSISEEEFQTFLDEFETECETFHDEAYVSYQELGAILESGNLTVGEAATIELLMADLTEMMDALGDEFSSEWGNASDNAEYLSRTVSAGGTETIDLDDSSATNGAVITVDASAESSGDEGGSSFDVGSAEEGYVDTDGDGVRDALWDANGDNIADGDWNNDGAITEEDNPLLDPGYNSNTVVIEGEDIKDITLSSYDDTVDPVVATFRIEKEDGTIVYVEIKGDCKIVMSPVPSNIDSMSQELTQRMFEFTSSEESYSYYIDGTSASDSVEHYTIIESSDVSNDVDVNVTTEDIEQGRDYTINCESGTLDDLTLDVPEDATVSIKKGDSDDQIIITITVDGKSSTITINNFDVSSNEATSDTLNINGGTISNSGYTAFNGWEQNGVFLIDFIYHNGVDLVTDGNNNDVDWDAPTYTPAPMDDVVIREGIGEIAIGDLEIKKI